MLHHTDTPTYTYCMYNHSSRLTGIVISGITSCGTPPPPLLSVGSWSRSLTSSCWMFSFTDIFSAVMELLKGVWGEGRKGERENREREDGEEDRALTNVS